VPHGPAEAKYRRLLPNDFGVVAGSDEAKQAPVIEVEIDFEVFGLGAELFEVLAADLFHAARIDGDRTGREFLWDQDGERLRAFFLAII